MLDLIEEISATVKKITNKLKKEYGNIDTSNPLPWRMFLLLTELENHLSYLREYEKIPKNQLSYHFGVVYNASVEINETSVMLKRAETVNVSRLVDHSKELFTKLVPYVVQLFGPAKALYIVPPRYQQLSGLK